MDDSDEAPSLPESLQKQILDYTGTKERGNSGFVILYINKKGDVECLKKYQYPYLDSVFLSAMAKMLDVHRMEGGL